MEDLKRVELTIEDLDGSLDKISLVSEPAIEVDFFFFNKQTKKTEIKFQVEDEEKMMVTGAAMIPNMDILRVDPVTGEEFLVWFSKDTIRKAAEVFFKRSDINSTNLEHEFEVEDITVFESWFIDKKNGKGGGKNFQGLPDGTWMVTMKIDNKEVWENFIKTGLVKGFSVEGMFIQNFFKIESIYNQIKKIINSIDE